MKQCIRCGIIKEYGCFSKREASKDGHVSLCKECRNREEKERRKLHPDSYKKAWAKSRLKTASESIDKKLEYRKVKYPDGLKKCSRCGELRKLSQYYKSAYSKDGLRIDCKFCALINQIEYTEKNYSNIQKRRKEIRYKNKPERIKILSEILNAYQKANKKRCTKCGILKSTTEFGPNKRNKTDGLYFWCKECNNKRSLEYAKKHKEQRKRTCKKYMEAHKDYYDNWRNENTELKKESDKNWRKNNKEHIKEQQKKRINEDEIYRIEITMRKAFSQWIKKQHAKKPACMEELIGYSRKTAITYLKNNGYDPNIHHIDHILPLSKFDAKNTNHLKIAWHYLNMQPLDPILNIKKGNRLVKNWEEILKRIASSLSIDPNPIIEHIKKRS